MLDVTPCPASPRLLYLLILLSMMPLSACALQSPAPLVDRQSVSHVRGAQVHGTLFALPAQRPQTFETLITALAQARVVALGEEHYHPEIQAFELRVLQALAQRQPQRVVLAMEFLERDMQPAVDAYLAGHTDAATLQAQINATPEFLQYYAPLLQYARQAGVPVCAMNAPRALARRVTREGTQAVVASLAPPERVSLAATLAPITPQYRAYFVQAVAAAHPLPAEQLERFVEAAYLKDETMAESLATLVAAAPSVTVLAIAGRFHMDYGLAVPALLRQRYPDISMVRVTTMAVAADDHVDLPRLASEGLADYVWFVPPAPESKAMN